MTIKNIVIPLEVEYLERRLRSAESPVPSSYVL
jgi:hypothetical protein